MNARLRWQSWDWGALVLRIVLGIIFLMHGSQKAFGAFGGHGPAGVAAMVGALGFHPARIWEWLLIFAELGGGLMLMVGMLTELAGLMIAIDMLVAIWKVHGPRGFFNVGQPPGYEYNLLILAVCLALILGGPGKFALWNPFAPRGTGEREG